MTNFSIEALERSDRFQPPGGPVVFVIMDGVGVGCGDEFDAVANARTPTLDRLRGAAHYRELIAHGTRVGLPGDGDMGNSEVGHNILGAGRVFDQGAKCVDSAIESGSIWDGTWRALVDGVVDRGRALHFVGLLSDGNVHASMQHLHAMLSQATAAGVRRIYLHCLLDGRDVPDPSAEVYIEQLETWLADFRSRYGGDFRIASGGGRMTTTMDRYGADWGMVERGWAAHVHGDAAGFASALEAVMHFRAETPGVSDQFLPAFVIVDEAGAPIAPMVDGDAVVLYNFRGDRALELSRAFVEDDDFVAFDRGARPEVEFVGMVQYDGDTVMPPKFLVSPETVTGTISEYLACSGLRQFACSETQKFGHVTFFWNGNRSAKFSDGLEDYLEIPSDRVPFEQRPWMKAAETADAMVEAIESGNYQFLRCNFAGGDMVGHTGSVTAVRMSVEAVDLGLERIHAAVEKAGGVLVVTADHGNADDMVERHKDGSPKLRESGTPQFRTSHSLNPVPFYILDFSTRKLRLRAGLNDAGLANVAPTLIELLGYRKPQEYDASLLDWD
ncbi:MAG: 2,3-bisphosphoglycerate-independent phosphoglycerate mutase [Pseudomonadota bacterium]